MSGSCGRHPDGEVEPGDRQAVPAGKPNGYISCQALTVYHGPVAGTQIGNLKAGTVHDADPQVPAGNLRDVEDDVGVGGIAADDNAIGGGKQETSDPDGPDGAVGPLEDALEWGSNDRIGNAGLEGGIPLGGDIAGFGQLFREARLAGSDLPVGNVAVGELGPTPVGERGPGGNEPQGPEEQGERPPAVPTRGRLRLRRGPGWQRLGPSRRSARPRWPGRHVRRTSPQQAGARPRALQCPPGRQRVPAR